MALGGQGLGSGLETSEPKPLNPKPIASNPPFKF